MMPACSLGQPVRSADVPTADESDVSTIDDVATVFPQSVASGGPTPTGVILWTRIAAEAYRPDVPMRLTVADDPDLDSVVISARIPPESFGPAHDYTLRVDVTDELDSNRHYFYRFVYDGVGSRIGRCRTLPAPGARPDRLHLAVVGCQHYQNGYYGAFGDLAREDVDFVLHFGDYIYESADQRYRGPFPTHYHGRELSLPSGHDLAWTLADFRQLYRTYRADPLLQAAHERHTFLRCWDDHAVANDRYWDYEADAPVAPDHPRHDDPAFMRGLTAAGIQAWWEYTPARVEYDPSAEHLHDAFHLWRRVDFGDLVSLLLTEERLFRSPPPGTEGGSHWCPETPRDHPERTMLGERQREWFVEEVGSGGPQWTVWGNEVLSMPFNVGVGRAKIHPNPDDWDGYTHERDQLFAALSRAENAVTLTGDMHSTVVGHQRLPDGTVAGVEFMTPAATSINIAEAFGVESGLRARLTRPLLSGLVRRMNPDFAYFDSHHWGYSTVEFTREACTFTVQSVDKTTDAADAARRRLVRFRVPAGTTDLHRRPV